MSAARTLARVALVTGAGSPSGIGMASARRLARDGTSLVLAATTTRIENRARELRDEGFEAIGLTGDLTDPAAAEFLVGAALERFGRLDVLVHNAGMTSLGSPEPPARAFASLEVADWERGIARNLDAAFYVVRAAAAHLSRDAGRVILVSSLTGPVMAMRHEAVYAAAKAGLVGLARALALEYAGESITVNAVAPGWIATASQTEHEAAQGRATPLGRSGRPEEVAAVIAFLASTEASYLTGQCLVVDGANSIAEERGL